MNHIENLEKILERVKTLKPEQFNFESYVTEFDEEKGCGTVCCIAGYLPQWFPNCGLSYKNRWEEMTIVSQDHDITTHLKILVGLPYDWINYLFYGKSCPVDSLPQLKITSSLEEVMDAWEKTIEYLKTNAVHQPGPYSLT